MHKPLKEGNLSSFTKYLKEGVVITGVATATLFCIYSAYTYSLLRSFSIDFRLFEHPFNNSLYAGVVILINNFGYVSIELIKFLLWTAIFAIGTILAIGLCDSFVGVLDFIRNPPKPVIVLSKFYEKSIEPILFLLIVVLGWVLMIYHFQEAGTNYASKVKEAKDLPYNMTILHDGEKKHVQSIVCDKEKCAGLEKLNKNVVYFKFSDIVHTTFE